MKNIKDKIVQAHCDIPCGVYDPIKAQYSAISLVRFVDQIAELEDTLTETSGLAKFSRLIAQKDLHAQEVKNEVVVIWGDYFKEDQIKKHPDIHDLVHNIIRLSSTCKQEINREASVQLVEKVNEFAEKFWNTKDIETTQKKSPNPPFLSVSYPLLEDA